MKISLRAGEKIYVNGAVFSVDRRVSLCLLNDATFLLEAHVMQPAEATSPLRQAYFAIQTMLMDPGDAPAIRPMVCRLLENMEAMEGEPRESSRLKDACRLVQSARDFEALRTVRELYRAQELAQGQIQPRAKESRS